MMPDITTTYIRRTVAIFREGERPEYEATRSTTMIVERLVLDTGDSDLLTVYGWRKQYYHRGSYVNGASHVREYQVGRTPPELVPWVEKMRNNPVTLERRLHTMMDEPESLDEQALQEDYDPQDLKQQVPSHTPSEAFAEYEKKTDIPMDDPYKEARDILRGQIKQHLDKQGK